MIGDYLFHIGSFGVPAMGFSILIGAIAAMILCYYAKRFTSLDWDTEILDGVIWAVVGGFIGMKLLYWIITPESITAFFQSPSLSAFWQLITAGMVFYGGLIGGILGLWLLARKKRRSFFTFSDLIVPCFCVAHAGGRIGCLLVGCCYGVADGQACLNGHLTYHGALALPYLNGVRRLPVPLMESVFLLLLAAGLLLLLKANRRRGTVTGWYLVLYAIWRFIIEFFRGDEVRGIFGMFSTSQWISFAILAAGIIILVLSRKWPKDEPIRPFYEDDLTVPDATEVEEEIILDGEREAEAAGAAVSDAAPEPDLPAEESAEEASFSETDRTASEDEP